MGRLEMGRERPSPLLLMFNPQSSQKEAWHFPHHFHVRNSGFSTKTYPGWGFPGEENTQRGHKRFSEYGVVGWRNEKGK